jgi:3-dehydrosphinganine reductase
LSVTISKQRCEQQQATKRMIESNIKDGKIVFVSSILGLMSFAGWSTYSPTKYAVRGLADTLRNELQRYNINIHIFYPGTIFTPGFETEVGKYLCSKM